jgi:Rad3-related DNA helicase
MTFEQKLVNKHVIQKNQLNAKVLCQGPSDISFNFTFDNLSKNREKIYRDLIETLIETCSHIPNGILLVFPSFRAQSDFQFELRRSLKGKKLEAVKHVMFEEKNSDTNMDDFKKNALSSKGALLGLICRGRLSEGIDFPDGLCRAVIIIGVPYANIKDPFIIEKKNHLDNIASRSTNKTNVIKGEEWYFMGTIRTINQALGRVIRHAKDYGSIFFIDKRYQEAKFKKELPAWVTESMEVVDAPSPAFFNSIKSFYRGMEVEHPPREQMRLE